MADQVNYYEVLGVSREASQEEIRTAYRRLAKERHPDHPSGSAREFSLLQEAHAVLSDPNRRRMHDEAREARWYEPHYFDPEPITWKTGAISFVAAFLAFIAAGQLGLWATGAADPGSLTWVTDLAPFLPILYALIGLVVAYFAFRAAGYAALALVFVAALVVGGQGPPEGLLQFGTLGIVVLLVVIWLGNRRERAARS